MYYVEGKGRRLDKGRLEVPIGAKQATDKE